MSLVTSQKDFVVVCGQLLSRRLKEREDIWTHHLHCLRRVIHSCALALELVTYLHYIIQDNYSQIC